MIELDRIAVCAGQFRLAEVSLRVPSGRYGVLMGPTGCGKTTLLESICGLRPVETGVVRLSGHDVTTVPASHRGIGFVPQEGAVFPRMTVWQNLAFPLAVRKRPRAEIDRKVRTLAQRLGVAPLLDRRAKGLSGGEAQRVALGRALASEPQFLLLDEPLSAVDESTREQLIELLQESHAQSGATVLHVTHSSEEAQRLGQVLLRMEGGRVVRAAEQQNLSYLPAESVP